MYSYGDADYWLLRVTRAFLRRQTYWIFEQDREDPSSASMIHDDLYATIEFMKNENEPLITKMTLTALKNKFKKTALLKKNEMITLRQQFRPYVKFFKLTADEQLSKNAWE